MIHWYFPPNSGGEESGLNDAGIETFRTSASLAREVIQNSCDAAASASDGPVKVTFTRFMLRTNNFPAVDDLKNVFVRSRDYMLGPCRNARERKQNGENFYREALRLLDDSSIPVLRIGDANTTGLEGSDSEPMSPWYRLVRKQGSSSMHGVGGGTFGIGQRAPFAFSALRTVFYSTLTSAGHAFIGKSILSSFKDDTVRRPVGFCGHVTGNHAKPVRNEEEIPTAFRRMETGLDLYVVGYMDENWKHSIARSAVENCFAAIHQGRLEVELRDPLGESESISRDNLSEIVERYYADDVAAAASNAEVARIEKSLGATRFYIKALSDPHEGQPLQGQLDRLGTVRLFLKCDEDANDRVAYMRSPRILVEEKRHGTSLRGFAGVFICDDPEGNRLLAALEDPTHRKWEREKHLGQTLLNELTRWVREALESVAATAPAEEQDIPDLDQYLPDETPEPDTAIAATDAESADPRIDEGTLPVRRRRAKPPNVVRRPDVGGPGADQAGGTGGGGEASGGGGGIGGGPFEGDGRGPHGSDGTTNPRLTSANVGFRSYFRDSDTAFILTLWSDQSGTADIKLRALGEEGDYDVSISEAHDADTGAQLATSGSRITKIDLAPTRRRIRVLVSPRQKLALRAEVVDAL